MSRLRLPLVLVVLGLFTQSGSVGVRAAPPQSTQSSQPAASDQAPTFRGGINFVRVDAIVTDKKGQPVTDLKQSDFEVLEDNAPQHIEQFRLVTIDGRATPGAPPPRDMRSRDDEQLEAGRDDVRVVVIFLDDYHVRPGNAIAVRVPLTRFIQHELGPHDIAAVMYPLTHVKDVSFTRDIDSLSRVIAQFEGRKYDYTPRDDVEENYIAPAHSRYTAQQVEEIRNDVVMDSLRGLSVRLGSLREGRKSVIVVSEGFTGLLPTAMNRRDAAVPDLPCLVPGQMDCNPALGADGHNRDPEFDDKNPRRLTDESFEQSNVSARMRDVITAANRNNVSIYSLDPRRLGISEYTLEENIGHAQDHRALQTSRDTLRTLSEQTDGQAIVNRNQVDGPLAQAVKDESVYYLLGYTSSQAPSDGQFHEIKVRVKRPGTEVRARKGYWAATVEDITKASKPTSKPENKPLEQALASIAPVVHSARAIDTWIGTARGDNGKTRVTLLWEPVSPAPGSAASARREQAGGVSVVAADAKGGLVFRGRSAGEPKQIVFDAPPGTLSLKLTVEGTGGAGTIDTDERTLDVPDLTKPDAALSTPRVFRSRTAREFSRLAVDPNARPTIARDFSRAERLLIRFDAYGPGAEQPMPSAVLLNRRGDQVADLPVAPAKAGGTHQMDLGLSTLAAGEYVVQITAKGQTGEAQQLVAFRIGS